ncbi:hypothetical protein [Acinetobacter seifertii]|uniref:hypothetical protein n=1 Tax=Acinetobacter seifertii TaxID=1530123 RepID=UPI000C22A978|nr:hypothetical protein [Acinetobacter seifertii]PJG65507.1 hypothetical protein CVD09_15885 [Acinetobacter seifertii]
MKAKLIVISLSLICTGPLFAGSNSMQDVFLKINSERETAHSLQKNRLIKVESGRFCNEHKESKSSKTKVADPQLLHSSSSNEKSRKLKKTELSGIKTTDENCEKPIQVS